MQTGLDRLPSLARVLARLKSSRVGVLAHPASVDRRLAHISDVLLEAGVKPSLFFGPEHGYGGEAQYMVGVASAKDERTGAPIVSLYNERFEDLSPKAEHLAAIDVLVIDLADVGSRYYTFIWTALLALRAAAKAKVPVIVLDRPNPLSGAARHVEGATQLPGFHSFVGLESVPIRHGLTIGEILAHFGAQDGLPLGESGALQVIGVREWDRDHLATSWDRPFVLTSPNMPTLETALVYPGGCLLEGTNLSDGRGTTRPFEITGAPWLDGRALAEALTRTGLPGFLVRPLTFCPTFHKHAGVICGGVQIHPTDPETFRPVATYTALIALARQQAPAEFRFRTELYEYVDTIPAIDLLFGSDGPRKAMDSGEDPRGIADVASRPDPAWSEIMDASSKAAERAER